MSTLKIKKIKPMFNRVLTTCDLYTEDLMTDGIIDSTKVEGAIKEYQTVIACGPMVKCVKPGDIVVVNPTRYQVMKHKEGTLNDGIIGDNAVLSYNFPIMIVDDAPCLYIYDSDIDFVIKEFEMVNDEATEIVESAPDIV
jgi:hypothetical protein